MLFRSEVDECHEQGHIEDDNAHDKHDRKRVMMIDLKNYLHTEQKTNGGIEDPEDVGAGFLVRYNGYKDLMSLEDVTKIVSRYKEGFFLPN